MMDMPDFAVMIICQILQS